MHPLFKHSVSRLLFLGSLLLAGCGAASASGDGSGSGSADASGYPQMKAMVLDIMHSKQGMDTLKDTISTSEFKRSVAITETDVKKAVEQMVNTQNQKQTFLSQAMKDPKFAASMVQAALPQIADIQKQLLNEPQYQKQLLALFKSPDYQQMQLDLLKSPDYRNEIMKIMTEALQQPTFRVMFTDSMKQAAKAATSQQQSSKSGGKQGGNQSGGSSSDSEGGGGESSDSGDES